VFCATRWVFDGLEVEARAEEWGFGDGLRA